MLFRDFADALEKIELTDSRLEMADIFAELLQKASKDEIKPIIYLSLGLVLPTHYGIELGLGLKLMFEALSFSTGYSKNKIEKMFIQEGDIGKVAQNLTAKKLQASLFAKELSCSDVYFRLLNIAKLGGKGSQSLKIKQIAELLNSSSDLEAKFISRFCVGNMRLGIREPTIIDALAKIKILKILNIAALACERTIIPLESVQILSSDFLELKIKVKTKQEISFLEKKYVELISFNNEKSPKLLVSKIEEVQENNFIITFEDFKKRIRYPIERAFNLCNDLGKVAEFSLFDWEKIENFKIEIFSPVRPALAERLSSPQEIIEKLGPCAADSKYDGFRLQIHKNQDKVELYSRKLERVTDAFPEISAAVRELKQNRIIFEGEAVGYDKKQKKFLPFQITIKRKRKYDIEKMLKTIPLHLFAFDLIYLDGVDYTSVSFEQRRKDLEKVLKNNQKIFLSDLKMVSDAAQLQAFFESCIQKGLEGIIAKDLSAPYVAGAREFAWIKLKKSYGKLADTIDCVIVGYYLGKGSRAEFNFGGLLVAVQNSQTGFLETIAKIGSGFSEKEMQYLQSILSKLKINSKPQNLISNLKPDFWVEPKIVISVSADEISLSPVHTCGFENNKGFALRFPRMVSIREDKSLSDITTTEEIKELYALQSRKTATS